MYCEVIYLICHICNVSFQWKTDPRTWWRILKSGSVYTWSAGPVIMDKHSIITVSAVACDRRNRYKKMAAIYQKYNFKFNFSVKIDAFGFTFHWNLFASDQIAVTS